MSWKRLNFMWGLITLILTAMLVFEGSAEAQSYKLKNYSPSSEGITWGYLQSYSDGHTDFEFFTIGGTETVNGIVTKKFWQFDSGELSDNPEGDHQYECVLWTKDGGRGYKEVNPDGSYVIFDPPLIGLPLKMSIGETFQHTSTATEHAPDGTVTDSYTYTIERTLMGVEDVTVKAGSFTKCLKFSAREGDEEYYTFWLAPGIGDVKWVRPDETRELISFTKGNKSYYPGK